MINVDDPGASPLALHLSGMVQKLQAENQRLRDERTTVCRCLGVTPLITPEELNHHATSAFCALLREPRLLAQREALLIEFCKWCRTNGIEFKRHDDSEQDVGRVKWFLASRREEDKP